MLEITMLSNMYFIDQFKMQNIMPFSKTFVSNYVLVTKRDKHIGPLMRKKCMIRKRKIIFVVSV